MKTKEKPVVGVVTEALSGGRYMVEIPEQGSSICYIGGRLKFNHIQILLGNRVEVILDPFKGKATNRIVKRL